MLTTYTGKRNLNTELMGIAKVKYWGRFARHASEVDAYAQTIMSSRVDCL